MSSIQIFFLQTKNLLKVKMIKKKLSSSQSGNMDKIDQKFFIGNSMHFLSKSSHPKRIIKGVLECLVNNTTNIELNVFKRRQRFPPCVI